MSLVKNKGGFTLLELLVAVGIFALIGVVTTASISRSFRLRDKVAEEDDFYHAIRVAFTTMIRDLNLAFHQPPARQEWQASSPLSYTSFKGEEKKLSFTSFSHRRLYKDAKESELCSINFSLEESQEGERVNYNLIKTENPYLCQEKCEGGHSFSLLERVKDFSLKYYDKTRDRWFSEWDSTRLDFKDKFPELIEIKIVVENKRQQEIGFLTQTEILSPNNQTSLAPAKEEQKETKTPIKEKKREWIDEGEEEEEEPGRGKPSWPWGP